MNCLRHEDYENETTDTKYLNNIKKQNSKGYKETPYQKYLVRLVN